MLTPFNASEEFGQFAWVRQSQRVTKIYLLSLVEKTFTVAMLFYSTMALAHFMGGESDGISQPCGNQLEFAVQSAFYGVAFFFIALRCRTFLRSAWNARWILLLVFFAASSTVWSQHPMVTLRRSVVMLASTAFGIYFGSRFSVPQQLRLLGWTCAFLVFTSFFMGIFLPQHGIDHLWTSGAWVGAFSQKNSLARAMVLSAMVFFFARPPFGRWVRWVGIAGAVCLLALSKSATGIVVLASIVAILPLYRLVRAKITFALPVITLAGVAALGSGFLYYTVLPSLLGVLKRDTTLTGRTEVWHAILLSIDKRPWFGYGFNAFWNAPGEFSSIVQQVNWSVPSGHNGFLDITLDLGLLGLAIFVIGYVSLWRRALRLLRRTTGVVPTWLCAYLAFMFLYSLTESTFFHQNNIFWILYASAAVSIPHPVRIPSGKWSHASLPAAYGDHVPIASCLKDGCSI